MRFLYLLFFVLLGPFVSIVYAYNVDTHTTLNQNNTVAQPADLYLKNQLGFTNGVDSTFCLSTDNCDEAWKWLGLGGEKEDEPLWRPRNHFHDPLTGWGRAGLNLSDSESAAVWAQDAANDWSWPAARDYFYQALTASSAAEREQAYADTFRALGQIMHLVEDMSNRLSAVSSQRSANGRRV